MTDDEKIDYIADMLNRGNDVREWPDDEAKVHRDYTYTPLPNGFYGSFEMRNEYVRRYRAKKILDYINDN